MTKCTSPNGRHNWEHIGNFNDVRGSGRSIRISLKGRYRCKICGIGKTGTHQ